ncbi:gamma-glutamyl-gamma-aminobutyrate hydrolase family protein [Pedobacter gandavensis]|uniref:Gamma-glutamyl-gamma-aminobutyrate hydrolase family protein n=1 Tax=Pedobacter gandavensis TaxID=2679963 RepID=A0ABR6F0D5_9SPHI|nr:gamma-glutamyl-gamma-aminobutyrate hydrolase family protein [Pedobacter gandavensis]MBB2150676.1 gamma-glutamyl-gamma-aminobutyrate hydrolase family protein [Pedobacter gandavensis]
MRKKIGISFTEAGFQNYWNWFTATELAEDLELLELSFEKGNTEDIEKCDGFVLTGGIDVTPAISGGVEDYPYRPALFSPERDEFERKLYEFAKREKLPLLGICRGMQYINILEGGAVFDDIGEPENAVHKKGELDKVHELKVLEGTLLAEIAGETQGMVNSAHHQAVNPDRLGENLMINAYAVSGSGMVEGLEYKDKENHGFMLAVQWHPERMKDKEIEPFSQKIKEQFIQEVRNHQK